MMPESIVNNSTSLWLLKHVSKISRLASRPFTINVNPPKYFFFRPFTNCVKTTVFSLYLILYAHRVSVCEGVLYGPEKGSLKFRKPILSLRNRYRCLNQAVNQSRDQLFKDKNATNFIENFIRYRTTIHKLLARGAPGLYLKGNYKDLYGNLQLLPSSQVSMVFQTNTVSCHNIFTSLSDIIALKISPNINFDHTQTNRYCNMATIAS